jgi:7,8-dihydroneopterin aldolase/epimerase/oxygenase
MDAVFIRGLRVEALIGVYQREREARQPLLLDVEIDFDNRLPAASDDLGDTLDYAEISQALRDLAAAGRHLLLETLAEEMAALLQRRFGARRVRLTIDKPEAAAALGCAHVGVRIEREFAPA